MSHHYFPGDGSGEEGEEEEEEAPSPEHDSWHSPEPTAPPTRRRWLPVQSRAGQWLERDAGVSNLEGLAALEERFDADGYSVVLRGDEQLDALAALYAGERHAINPIGMEFAQQRGMYDPNYYSIFGLGSPRDRMGGGLCLQNNRCVPAPPPPSLRPAP